MEDPTPGPSAVVMVPPGIVLSYVPGADADTLKETVQEDVAARVPLSNVMEVGVNVIVPPH